MSGRVWVVTGASSGFGLAISLYALKQGDKVITTVRNASKFPAALKEAGAHPLYVDMSSPDDIVRKAAADAIAVYGHVDVLVNNAATITIAPGPLEEIEMSDVRSLFQVNLFAGLTFTQPFITHFRTRRSGHILNISSNGGQAPSPTWDAYSATKAALNNLTETLAQELRLFNVKVHLIVPGFFPTGILPDDPLQAGFKLSEFYVDPETQGYDTARTLPYVMAKAGQVGDTEKLAERTYELVAGAGLVGSVLAETNRPDWVWVPMGSMAGETGLKTAADKLDNFRAYERIWRSADMGQERLAEFRAQIGVGK